MAPTKLHGITFYNVLSMQGFQRTKHGRLSDPAKIQNGAPILGQHNRQIFGEVLGIDKDTLEAFLEQGVI